MDLCRNGMNDVVTGRDRGGDPDGRKYKDASDTGQAAGSHGEVRE